MGFVCQPNEGFQFSFGPWQNCKMFANEDSGVGNSIIVGIGPVSAIEYISIGTVWMGDLSQVGPLGPFITSLYPLATAICKNFLNKNPGWAPINNTDPPTVSNVNKALSQYCQAVPSPDGNYPVIEFRPYP